MPELKVGNLVIKRETITFKDPDFGIVTEIKERELRDKYVTIYWFVQKKSIQYFDLDIQWFFTGDKSSLWLVF